MVRIKNHLPIHALFFIAVALRSAAAHYLLRPLIYADEWWHILFAQSVLGWHGLHWGGHLVQHPDWLYPMFLALWLDPRNVLASLARINVANALAMNSTLFVAYGLALWCGADRRRAFAAAALTALTACMSCSVLLMAENLFMPAAAAAFWIGLIAMEKPTVKWRVCAGLALGLLYHIKPQGLFYPLIFAASVAACEALPSARCGSPGWRGFFAAIMRQWLTAAVCMAVLLLRCLEAKFMEGDAQPFGARAFLGSYYGRAMGDHLANDAGFIWMTLCNFAVFFLALGALPFIAMCRDCAGALRASVGGRRARLAVTGAVAAVVVIAFSARHTVLDDMETCVYERYLMPLAPLALASFCLPGPRRAPNGVFYAGWTLVAAVFAFFLFWLCREKTWLLESNLPSLSDFQIFRNRLSLHWALNAVPASALLASLIAGWRWRRSFRGAWVVAAGALLVMNYGWYASYLCIVNPIVEDQNRIAVRIAKTLPPGAKLIVLRDGMEVPYVHRIEFYNLAWVASDRPDWNEEKFDARYGVDAALRAMNAAPASADIWLCADAAWIFSRRPDHTVKKKFCLYRVAPGDDLRLEKAPALLP